MSTWPTASLGVAGTLLHDPEVAMHLSPEAELEALLAVERALARAQRAVGDLSAADLAAIEVAAVPEGLDWADLRTGLRRDGMVVPALVRQIRARLGAGHSGAFHKGATSQDVIDSALMLRLKAIVALLGARLTDLADTLDGFAAAHAQHPVMARTRFQDALPFTLGRRVETWTAPLRDLAGSAPAGFPLQLGGPIGVPEAAYGAAHREIARLMAEDLGLTSTRAPWHTDRRALLAVAIWMTAVTTVLGKIGYDVALMAQTAVGEVRVPGGRSSAMAHKRNPVAAELLVTLSSYAAGQLAILQGAGLHEGERSGIAWTLEWLALPPLALACGASTRGAGELVAGLEAGAATG